MPTPAEASFAKDAKGSSRAAPPPPAFHAGGPRPKFGRPNDALPPPFAPPPLGEEAPTEPRGDRPPPLPPGAPLPPKGDAPSPALNCDALGDVALLADARISVDPPSTEKEPFRLRPLPPPPPNESDDAVRRGPLRMEPALPLEAKSASHETSQSSSSPFSPSSSSSSSSAVRSRSLTFGASRMRSGSFMNSKRWSVSSLRLTALSLFTSSSAKILVDWSWR
mmetsp:Transcript_81157/g.225486  ORF Transcript_81157/g.225486 Transcript_81157/m.225486 type:complete len:222 (+) Transcript_81157:270-935(+)